MLATDCDHRACISSVNNQHGHFFGNSNTTRYVLTLYVLALYVLALYMLALCVLTLYVLVFAGCLSVQRMKSTHNCTHCTHCRVPPLRQ